MHDDLTAGPNPSGLCMCGCGQTTPLSTVNHRGRGLVKGKPMRFCAKHNSRGRVRPADDEGPNPTGLCQCGCGEPAPIAQATNNQRGHVRGKPLQFVAGHTHRGRRSGNWKGGRVLAHGRVFIYVGETHPMSHAGGYVFEHRLVMARKIGRMLTADEIVHHVNEDSLDNRTENLRIVSQAQHAQIHNLIARGRHPAAAVEEICGPE